jgi:sugar lactone lactonase YvrE
MRTSPAVLLSIVATVCGLGCGDDTSSGPLVTVSPGPTHSVSTGDPALTFQATLSNGATGPVTWTLDQAGLGTISTDTGLQTSYQPPPLGSSGGTVKLRATAGTIGYTTTITVNTATTGALTINVVVPNATPVNLTVTGPNGFSQAVVTQTSTTLTGLAPGVYTVTGAEVVDNSSGTVDTKYSAAPVAATVGANATATATVTYELEPGYGRLWVAGATTSTLDGFTEDDLFVNKTPTVTPGTSAAPQGIAFELSGAMWVSLSTTSLVRYAAADLATAAATPPLTPTVTITDLISDPAGVALGPDGRIWVANCNNTVTAYSLAGGTAAVVVHSTSFQCPRGIAFDTAGNLWVANRDGGLQRFPNAQIATTNPAAVPDITPTAASGGSQPYGVALDKDGNLWVAFCGGSKVARYASPTYASAVAILSQLVAPPPLNIDCPVALALDKSGRLWVGNKGTAAASGTLSVFTTTDMASSGTPSPLNQLTGIGIVQGGLAFNPTASNLPIRH